MPHEARGADRAPPRFVERQDRHEGPVSAPLGEHRRPAAAPVGLPPHRHPTPARKRIAPTEREILPTVPEHPEVVRPFQARATATRPPVGRGRLHDALDVRGSKLLMDRKAHGAFEAGHRRLAAGRPRREERPAVDATGREVVEEAGGIRRPYREDEGRRAGGEVRPALGNEVAQHLEQRSEVRPPPVRVGVVRQDGQEHGGARADGAARRAPVDSLDTLERSRRAGDEHRAVRSPQHRSQTEDGGVSMPPDGTARRLGVECVCHILQQQEAVALAPVSPRLGVPGEPERVAHHD